jgi:urease accessory protein
VLVTATPVIASPATVAPGTGILRFTNVDGRTVATRAFASSPLKLLNPQLPGPAAWVYTATYGGGLVGGDRIDVEVDLRAGSRAVLTTQASTKVYRSELESSQRLRARVRDDALLVVAPDPLVGFAGARYAQRQTFDLDAAASLVFVDWITAGRHRSGERWAFARYASRLRVRRAGRLVLADGMTLDPVDGPVDERMRQFNCLATAVFTGPAIDQSIVFDRARDERLLISVAPLRDEGVLVRLAAESVEHAAHALAGMIAPVGSQIGGEPWAGKW